MTALIVDTVFDIFHKVRILYYRK